MTSTSATPDTTAPALPKDPIRTGVVIKINNLVSRAGNDYVTASISGINVTPMVSDSDLALMKADAANLARDERGRPIIEFRVITTKTPGKVLSDGTKSDGFTNHRLDYVPADVAF